MFTLVWMSTINLITDVIIQIIKNKKLSQHKERWEQARLEIKFIKINLSTFLKKIFKVICVCY